MKAIRVIALLLSLATVFQACKDDTAEVVPLPTISVSGTLSGIPGATVQIKASINAPGGVKTVTVLKNGAAYDTKTGTGEKTLEYTKDYVIENLAAGSIVNFTVQVTDQLSQVSTLTTIPVTVTAIPAPTVVTVQGNLEGNITWTADKIYKLVGFVRVGEEAVAGTVTKTGTLTIEPGTIIIGDRASKGTLVVQRGSKLIAQGTAAKPIVFTSERAVGEREAGDWGGIVICGRAVNNLPEASRVLEGNYGGFHGGTDNADNSGVLKYVRVEYAGIPVQPNAEVNSYTFGSVGSGTTLEYLQASFGLDDSFEWFGGSVNAKYLIAYKGLDDDFDVDNGFTGNVQFGIGIRGATQADISGSNGFEVDNDAAGSSNTPFTSGTFANMTIIGPKGSSSTTISSLFQNGMQLRRNNKLKIYNAVVTGYPYGVYIDSQRGNAKDNALNGELVLNNIVLAGVDGWGSTGFGTSAVSDNEQSTAAPAILIGTQKPSAWFAAQTGNKILANSSTIGLSSSLWLTGRPTFTLASGSSLVGVNLPTTLPAFFTKTTYVGAFNDVDWTTGWAEFNPQGVTYVK
ncbi:Ig-like domain repeat protein [Arcicella rigui]|uniref:Ig-like domain repeat protein n=1 Tax=Arcicella rigui TaxID=797020 RepID=A0ABU5Q4S0_9BACT|nr:Ig-like domain repeat protein [Arcicella rigui]MEA5137796.1 Ig-like domain repeat protein [Arcicella rigui]